MFSLYLVLKFIHILSAIVAVGANITYGVWNVRGAGDPAHLGFALKGIKFLDDRIANPAYGVLLLTGLIMVFMQWRITDLWIILALVLFAAVVVLGVAFDSPLLKNEIKLGEEWASAAPEHARLSPISRGLGPGLGWVVGLVPFLMEVQ